jgi:hypothetical protein
MKDVMITFITDNSIGKTLAASMSKMNFPISLCEDITKYDFQNSSLYSINIMVIDVEKLSVDDVLAKLGNLSSLHNIIKFVTLDQIPLKYAVDNGFASFHVEFIERPCNEREFSLLIEKTIIVEKYRKILKEMSEEYESRISSYDNLFHKEGSPSFESEEGQQVFARIMEFEHNLIKKQEVLNTHLKEFSPYSKKSLFDAENLLFANNMLDKLREKELYEAKDLITAQERLMEFSTMEMGDLKELLKAQEKVVELSRDEEIALHSTIKQLTEQNKNLLAKNKILEDELSLLKAKRGND